MTKNQLEKLALLRAREILSSWWFEDTGEYQEEMQLTDEELETLLEIRFDIKIKDKFS